MAKRPIPDCRKCGACCATPYETDVYADITERDAVRLGEAYIRRNVFVDDYQLVGIKTRRKVQRAGPLKGCDVCVCTSLRGSLLNRVSCVIYDRRPKVCRLALKPGDSCCLELRLWLKDEADYQQSSKKE